MIIDITTFTLAVLMLLLVHVPRPPLTEEGRRSMGSLWKESLYGFWYIIKYPSLLGLQLTFLVGNFLSGMCFTLLAPMVLSRTGDNSLIYGSVMSAGAIGGLLGSPAPRAGLAYESRPIRSMNTINNDAEHDT
jgi:hypothetical protein